MLFLFLFWIMGEKKWIMEMLGLNSKVLWPKLSAHFPPFHSCVLWLKKDKCEKTVCVLDASLLSSSSKNTHSCFIRHSTLPCVSNHQPNKFPGALLRMWVCVWQKKGHRETQKTAMRETCSQGFWHLAPNESHFCCFVQRCLRQAWLGSSTSQHLCNDQIHWKAPMIVTSIYSKISTSCSLGIKICYWNSQLLMQLLSSMALRS